MLPQPTHPAAKIEDAEVIYLDDLEELTFWYNNRDCKEVYECGDESWHDVLKVHTKVKTLSVYSRWAREWTQDYYSAVVSPPNLEHLSIWWWADIDPDSASHLRTLEVDDCMEDWEELSVCPEEYSTLFRGKVYPNMTKLVLPTLRKMMSEVALQEVQTQFPNADIVFTGQELNSETGKYEFTNVVVPKKIN